MKNQIVAILFSALLVLSLFPAVVSAEEQSTSAESLPPEEGASEGGYEPVEAPSVNTRTASPNEGPVIKRQRYVDERGNVHWRTVIEGEDGGVAVRRGVRTDDGDARVVTRGVNTEGDYGRSVRTRNVLDDGSVVNRVRQARLNEDETVDLRGRRTVRAEAGGEVIAQRVFARADVSAPRAAEALDSARERFLAAKETYQERKDRFLDARGNLGVVRDRLANCDVDSSDCESIKEEYAERAADFLIRSAETLSTHVDRIISFVGANVEDEELRTDLITKLEEVKSEVETVKSNVESIENPTREDLQPYAKELKEIHNKVKRWTLLSKQKIVHYKVLQAGQKMINLEDKLYSFAERLEEAGADTTNLNALLEDYTYLLDTTSEAHEAAREACNSAETNEGRSEECQTLVEDAKATFQDAVSLVKEIHEEIRYLRAELNGNVEEVTEEEYEEALEESEE